MLKINERNVRVLMAAAGIETVEELARRAGVSSATVRRLFAGEEFRSSTWHAVSDALQVNPLDILVVEGYPAPHLDAPAFALSQ